MKVYFKKLLMLTYCLFSSAVLFIFGLYKFVTSNVDTPDIQSISVSKSALSTIQKETPEFIHFYVYHEDDTLSVKMQRHQVLTDDFKVHNQDGRV